MVTLVSNSVMLTQSVLNHLCLGGKFLRFRFNLYSDSLIEIFVYVLLLSMGEGGHLITPYLFTAVHMCVIHVL